jgi:translocation and assembly module TamB
MGGGLPAAGLAQESDDRSYLTAFLEDNLSGAGRQVTITGFEGALSSRATIEKLQIADDQGVWITLDQVVLDWSRSALLSGEVVINELTAVTITLDRIPAVEESGTPAPEATPFALPDLPVSIEIGEISAERIVLGAPVLGEPVEATISATMRLAGGEGQGSLQLKRTDDGPDGQIVLEAAYSNSSGRLSLNLDAREDADGIAADLLDLPGRPSTALTVNGEGTLGDFSADIRLETDGIARLSGPVTIAEGESDTRKFSARLAGNPAPLFAPRYAGFLGEAVDLEVTGQLWPDGALRLEQLVLDAESLRLEGSLGLAADGLPQDFDLTARIAAAEGTPVLLPLSGTETRIDLAELKLRFDAAKDSGWSGDLVVEGLDRADFRASRATLAGSGRIGRVSGANSVGATLEFVTEGLSPTDTALATAMGSFVTGKAIIHWRQGDNVLNLPQIMLTGDDYALRAGLRVAGLDDALTATGQVTVTADDLMRFSALAGRPLGGSAEVGVNGEASILSGAFDLDLSIKGERLVTGIEQADGLLAGPSVILASIRRDETGTTLESLSAQAASLRISGTGKLTSGNSSLEGRLDWGNLADLGGSLGGALQASARFDGNAENATATLEGSGQGLRIGQPEVDRLLAGNTDLSVKIAIAEGSARLSALSLDAPNLTANVADTGGGALSVTGRLANLGLIVPEFPGVVTLSGQIRPEGDNLASDLRISGPAGIDARIAGRIVANGPDLAVSGTSDAGVANGVSGPVALSGPLRYDLALRGGWSLSALSGRITLSNGRIAVPARGISLERVAVAADLAGGQARLTATAEAGLGGRLRVAGTIGLMAPFGAALDVVIDALRLRDPQLFTTQISGNLRLSGPLLGQASLAGRISVGETELRVPSTGFATAAELESVTHVGDSAAVRATRVRAGVGASVDAGGAAASGLPDWALALEVSAPNRVFLRGRGLDAELGGSVSLGGSLRNVVPSGGLRLIRGRLDLLGKRLVLSEAELSLEGSLVPYLRVSASNQGDDVISYVTIEGPADEPEVTFSSIPELPQEEVLSQLLFGRGLDTLSAFQAAQLANAVAVLAGRGGEGIVSKLRKGFGFDDLDITTDSDGEAKLSAGKYISENIYTEFSVGQDGTSRINLNLDVKPGVTVKGRVDSDGESGVGIYLEKDY